MRRPTTKTCPVPALLLSSLALLAPTALAESQKERCAANPAVGNMRCVNRLGHCVELLLDGEPTAPLTDEATGERLAEMDLAETACWQVARPLPAKLRVVAKGGGLVPAYVGKVEQVRVTGWALGAGNGAAEARELEDLELVPDGAGAWVLKPERPLKAGSYLLVFRVVGSGNWDRQAVLVTLDPKASSGPKPAR